MKPVAASITPLTVSELDLILQWRNDNRVRRVMFSSAPIDPATHHAWFAANHQAVGKQLLLYREEGAPLGFCQFGELAHGVVEWGFYRAPDAPKGTGRRLMQAMLDHAFSGQQWHKVFARVLPHNLASHALHRELGFAVEGVLRDQHLADGQYHDVHCYGMLAAEWFKRTGGR